MTKEQLYRLILKNFIGVVNGMAKQCAEALIPAVCAGAAISAVLYMVQRRKRGKTIKKRCVLWGLFAAYIMFMAEMAIFMRPLGSVREVDLIPFDRGGGLRYVVFFAGANALVFIPLGILIPALFRRIDRAGDIAVIGLAASFTIEVLQFALGCGVSQTEDLIMNTLGAVLGYIIWKKHTRIKK